MLTGLPVEAGSPTRTVRETSLCSESDLSNAHKDIVYRRFSMTGSLEDVSALLCKVWTTKDFSIDLVPCF